MTRTHRASFLPPSSAGIPDRYLTALVLFDELAVRVRSSVEGLSSADRLGGGDRSGQYRLDLVADADVVDSLLASGYNVLSEESGFHDQGASLTVVVDPVDGSTNASRGLPWWASSFSLVAEVDGALTPVASLVADHGSGAVFSAVAGAGAWHNGVRLPLLGACRPSEEAIVGLNGRCPINLGWAQTRTFGALALDLCCVAEGRLDGYVDAVVGNHAPWDYLGALLVVSECGGVVVDALGQDLCVLDHAARRSPVAAPTIERCETWIGTAAGVLWR